MKLSNLLMLLIIAGGAYYYWHHLRPDEAPEPVITDEREESPPDFSAPFRKTSAPLAVPEPTPEPPPVEAVSIQEEIIDRPEAAEEERITPQAIRETLALQRSIEVPHPLENARTLSGTEYQNASVYRRHAVGLLE